ncbi:hypothetical protein BGZ95_003348 [Linnemannia exigua]|uniref:Uncharacterized protein n=1 Tax=Linnemannia exigua TaxID=604196 RepID=A0AAD4D4B0_9FUNG|nr:hypothetical protein BGZ95_003348 [Linnemannia exigua]
MTPFIQPAAYTPPPPPPSPSPAASISRSDRFLAPTVCPARNGTNNGFVEHSSNTTPIPSSSTTVSIAAQRVYSTMQSTPTPTTTAINARWDEGREGKADEEKRQGQKQKQEEQPQGPCTLVSSPTLSRTLSSNPSTSSNTPDNYNYQTTIHSRSVHILPHQSRPIMQHQQQQRRQHSLSHKKDAPYYYISQQQQQQHPEHQQLQQHLQSQPPYAPSAQHAMVSLQREPSFRSLSSKLQGGGAQPNIGSVLLRTPDSRYLEAFEGYFEHHSYRRLEDSVALDVESGDELASEDDDGEDDDDDDVDEEPKIRWAFSYKANRDELPRRERRRSRSVSGVVSPPASPISSSPWTSPPSRDPYDGLTTPMSRTSSLLVSPAMDGTVTTPPPSSRVSYTPRRRHHSCVAPNTKEFQTLATIFGWVTDASAAHTWPVRSEEEEEEEEQRRKASIESVMDSSPQYVPRRDQTTACASDDDSDLDDCFRQSSLSASWCTSRESRGSELSQGRIEGRFEHNPQSSNGSIEFLAESNDGNGAYAVASSWTYSSKSSGNSWQTETPESERSACPSESPSSLSSAPTPPQLHSVDDFLQQVRSRVLQPCQVVSSPEVTIDNNHHHSLLLTTSPLPPRTTGRSLQRSDTMSTRHSSESLFSPRDSELESPYTQCSNSTLMSPLSCSHGKDAGYMPFSYNRHGQPMESFTTCVTQSLNNLSSQLYDHSEDAPADKTAIDNSCKGCATNAPEGDTEESLSPPPIPPRYPEIDLRVFDHPEVESTETIVYAPPLEGSKRESLSGTLELRPVVAATIVKLIEKLTHQYGMDSGFMADFFLTYRLFMSPVQLCKYLIQRYLWALEEDTEFRCVVRVRTFVVFRFWINNHFADDFLTSKSLRFQMASFLNEMRFNARVQTSPRDSRIIRNLMDFFKYQRRYYKGLAQQSATAELERYQRQCKYDSQNNKSKNASGQDSESGLQTKASTEGMMDSAATATMSAEAVVDRLRVSIVHRQVDPVTGKVTTSDVTDATHAPHPTKGRHRAYTLGGMITSKSTNSDVSGKHSNAKPPLSKEPPRTAQQMGRQASEGSGLFTPRERRLSSSSVKSNRSTSTWSTKFVNKIRQKSEDFYQHIVHSSSGSGSGGVSGSQHRTDGKHQCVCWTLAYIGISEHHALNTARSFPNLRPSVISNQYQPHQQQQDTVGSGVGSNTSSSIPGLPSNKSIKRLKSSLSLGLHSTSSNSSTAIPSPASSPTRNQFSGISSRHSRTNSNSSVGYHPNPECPYHVPCVEAIQITTDAIKPVSSVSTLCESGSSSATFTTLKEALSESHGGYNSESGSSSQPHSGGIVPPSPSWNYGPWHSSAHQLFPTMVPPPPYKPFILFYRSQLIAQQLCLLEQHFLENVKWDELLEVELCRAGRKSRSKVQSSISGYMFRAEGEPNGMDASNERSNMLCMWVASEVVSTRVLDDRVRVIEKFIRIAQKCYQYRNFNSLIQLVMGLGSSPLCGLRRTWARVNSYEMRILHDLQGFISPFGNWSHLRKAMNQVGYQETAAAAEKGQRLSIQSSDTFASSISSIEPGHSKYLQYQAPLDKQGCIPFLGLFVFDLTHIAVSPSWFLPQVVAPTSENCSDSEENNSSSVDGAAPFQSGLGSVPPTPMKANHMATAARLEAPEPKDLQDLMPSGTLLVHFYRYQLIAKTIKWFMAFQQRSPKYTFPVDSTLYSKCFLLRVLTKERVKELAIKCESE